MKIVVQEPKVHPRPQLTREAYRILDGEWDFAYDPEGRYHEGSEVNFDRMILVPFPPESVASGLGDERFHPVVWYRRRVALGELERGQRLLLHFGAVDYFARVWVNGRLVAEHIGGHTPFYADITEALRFGDRDGEIEIVVRAEDDPRDLAKPRGKQDWLERPHEIWYPRTTGIWQSVWLEPVPETRIERLAWTPYLEEWAIALDVWIDGPILPDTWLRVRLFRGDEVIADDRYLVTRCEIARRIALADPGIDDFRNQLLWSPENPTLIDAAVELWRGGERIDRVFSYTALRSVGVSGNRFMLNGRPYFLKMVLDQGYWPETMLAPPSGEALRRDVELTKMLGFNGVRKHQKIEDPRWLYWCDRLGLMVWAEMPSPYRFTQVAVRRLVAEWTEAIRRDYSHPCIVTWVPLNESWGVPDLLTNPAHRDYVRALYHLTKTLDPTRPVVGNDGWEHIATDIITIHDYAANAGVLYERYATPEDVIHVLERQQPGGRALTLEGFTLDAHPFMVSEFGGIAFMRGGEGEGWGYSRASTEADFVDAYRHLLGALNECRGIAGFCYTQLTDTFQEKNGLLTHDRKPKADIRQIAEATRGRHRAFAMDVNPLPIPEGFAKQWRRRRS
ncbi:MAG TPA: glycoside hydrolase family 2 TIM barrel-domain containing protein [Polyangiaceae bacterium]|jgi:beta-galactosidase/beta-glucuronidase|nr:glycoside hydrolase family 2 TIM barrel-domain containing protein [Polyangiaceae bacterium]